MSTAKVHLWAEALFCTLSQSPGKMEERTLRCLGEVFGFAEALIS